MVGGTYNPKPGMIYGQRTQEPVGEAGIGVRIAAYSGDWEPEITESAASDPRSATRKFSRLVMERVKEGGGKVPAEAVGEVIENLIHADYKGVVVSVLSNGNIVRVSDKGPGIQDKQRALEFGFSGATSEMCREIRGIGAGLGIARAAVEKVGGRITLEDNIGGGTVTTISVPHEELEKTVDEPAPPRRYPDAVPRMDISERQEKVLFTVLENGEIGPSTVAEQLEISVSTAYRDLSVLEEHGLLSGHESGKRVISPLGRDLAEAIIRTWVQ
ncbi:MAG: DeoR family transcriptional regulator [Rubrobacter sp.]|nr:DeoR family transcriptional regulator [Rubrobacter sp.]